MPNISEVIKNEMVKRKWSSGKLEQESGVDASTIRQMFRRGSEPGATNLARYAKAFKISTDELLSLTTKEKTASIKTLDVVEIPVKGVVPAGYPFVEEENAIDILTLPQEDMRAMKNIEGIYALKVQGESLAGDNIHDGDYVIVDRNYGAFVNDKVYIVRIGNEVTVKHVHRENGKVKLVSSNEKYPVMEFKNIEILGRVFKFWRGGDL